MIIDTSKLIKISSYAKKEGITVPAVYKRMKRLKVKTVIIDGMKLVLTNVL